MVEGNKWELYSDMDDWEEVAERLDNALANALQECDAAIASGVSYGGASRAAFNAVLKVMEHPTNAAFGSSDTVVRDHMSAAIEKHIAVKYKSTISVG